MQLVLDELRGPAAADTLKMLSNQFYQAIPTPSACGTIFSSNGFWKV